MRDEMVESFKKELEKKFREMFEICLGNIHYKREGEIVGYMVPEALKEFADVLNDKAKNYIGEFKEVPKVH